jgi:hypothetical protein
MGKDRQQVVRLMAPFSMRCNTCDFWVPKAKKFNARKETVQGEEYYGIKVCLESTEEGGELMRGGGG